MVRAAVGFSRSAGAARSRPARRGVHRRVGHRDGQSPVRSARDAAQLCWPARPRDAVGVRQTFVAWRGQFASVARLERGNGPRRSDQPGAGGPGAW